MPQLVTIEMTLLISIGAKIELNTRKKIYLYLHSNHTQPLRLSRFLCEKLPLQK